MTCLRGLVIVTSLFCSVAVYAQNPAPAPQSAPATHSKSADEQEVEKREQSQRLLGVIPNFGTTNRQDAPPLSPKAKFRLFYKSAFDPVELSVAGLQAGISQANDEFPEYGQGATGFGKRFGASFADEVSSSFFANYFYPVLLRGSALFSARKRFREAPPRLRAAAGSRVPHRQRWTQFCLGKYIGRVYRRWAVKRLLSPGRTGLRIDYEPQRDCNRI